MLLLLWVRLCTLKHVCNLKFRHQTSTRASFRGFCEGLLQDEKVTIQVPEVVEASISFDEDSSSLDPDEERENSVDYISIADVKVCTYTYKHI